MILKTHEVWFVPPRVRRCDCLSSANHRFLCAVIFCDAKATSLGCGMCVANLV